MKVLNVYCVYFLSLSLYVVEEGEEWKLSRNMFYMKIVFHLLHIKVFLQSVVPRPSFSVKKRLSLVLKFNAGDTSIRLCSQGVNETIVPLFSKTPHKTVSHSQILKSALF
jgi:hypothetical protein